MLENKKTFDDHAEYVMSFVSESGEYRRDFEDVWEEVETNYLVRSLTDVGLVGRTDMPLMSAGDPNRGQAILKDPETHQEVMTIVSKIVLNTMGEPGFIRATPKGFEDTFRAGVVSKLLEYDLRRPGHFWQFVVWIVNAAVYGTGILESFWDYKEEPRNFRSVTVDPYTGMTVNGSETLVIPVVDDPCIKIVDIRDFYPDPGSLTMQDMYGCAKRFTTTAGVALADARFDKAKVKEAVTRAIESRDRTRHDSYGPEEAESGTDLKVSNQASIPLIGYEYYGEVPTKEANPDAGLDNGDITRRVITVLGGETVRNEPWPRALPFFDCRLTPRLNSFYGLGAAEVIRYDQDFADMIKMQLATAVVRMMNPPPLVNRFRSVDVSKLRNPQPNRPIFTDNVADSVNYLDYNPAIEPAFAMQSNVKGQMREATGALGAVQGLGLGSKRFSATEASSTMQQALDRPELFAQVVEREWLPPLGKFLLELNQEFLEDDKDLQDRIGESNVTVAIGDILANFDINFVGSRQVATKAEKLQAYRELFSGGASNPIMQQVIPWIPLIQKYISEGLGLEDIAAMVGNPQMVQLHMMLNTMVGATDLAGNGNGTAQSLPPAGQMPAQGFGDEQPV